MVNPKKFIELLKKNKINFFSGTPDSVLSNFLELLKKEKNFFISPHEGIAVSSAIGYYYATKKIPMVFMQHKLMVHMSDIVELLWQLLMSQVWLQH